MATSARTRRRRWPFVLAVLLVVLVGLFVAVDRIALAVVEDKAASTLQTSQDLKDKPNVSVAGFPFLTQLARGRFGKVTIEAKDVDVGSVRTLRIADVAVTLDDVTVPHDYSSVHAQTAAADAHIAYADLSSTLDTPVRYAGAGRVAATPRVSVLGRTFSATVSAAVHASSSTGISFDDLRVQGVSLPPAASSELTKVFKDSVSLAGLPFHVTVTGVDVAASGLVLHLAGRDLEYTR